MATAKSSTSDRAPALRRMCDAAGPRGWTADPDELAPHLVDWRGRVRGTTPLMLKPATTEALQAIVRIAAETRVPLVPQGGNTGLAAGATPPADGSALLVSMRRMNRIRAVDARDHSLVAEAGVTLSEVHDAAAAIGCMFPLSLGAKGSATVGGLVSTNAGGVQVLRYGTMRSLVLGLEAVLPDGSLLNQLTGLRKDNSGYDVKQLLIGGEGTLGFVTAAVLKLVPAPAERVVAIVGLSSVDACLDLLHRLDAASGSSLDSFEIVPRYGIELVLGAIEGTRDPLSRPHPWYALVEATSARRDSGLAEALESALGEAIDEGAAADAAIASNERQREALWKLRETLPEADRQRNKLTVKHDVSVAVGRVPAFIAEATAVVEQSWAGARVLAFGHLGDGNVHLDVALPPDTEEATFRDVLAPAVTARVYELVRAFAGSISAEHGIGALKREAFARYVDPAKLAAIRAVKAALDPLGIMNPGKLV